MNFASGTDVRGVIGPESVRWYDGLYDDERGRGYALRARMETVLRLAGEGPGDALDAGMGPGRLCAELERVGWRVTGIDMSAEMVALARRRLPNASDRLLRASIDELPFDDRSFDLVTATGVLEYSGVPRALPEIARVLRPAGKAVLSYPAPGTVYGTWKSRVYYPLARRVKGVLGYAGLPQFDGAPVVTPARLRDLLADSGLVPTVVAPTSYLVIPAPVDELMPRVVAGVGRRLESRRIAPRRLATQLVIAAERTT